MTSLRRVSSAKGSIGSNSGMIHTSPKPTLSPRHIRPHFASLHRNGMCLHRRPGGRAYDLARSDIEPGAMPRALHDESVETTLAEWPTSVRTCIVDAVDLARDPEQRKGPGADRHTRRSALLDVSFRSEVDSHERPTSRPRINLGDG